MKLPNSNRQFRTGLFTALLLALVSTASSADAPVTLKDTFKNHFPIGTAVNRSMMTGGAGFRRGAEQNAADVALLKQQNDNNSEITHMRKQILPTFATCAILSVAVLCTLRAQSTGGWSLRGRTCLRWIFCAHHLPFPQP